MEGKRWIRVFPFLSDLTAADSEVMCCVSKEKLHFQPKFIENILMYRMKNIAGGILDFLSCRAFKSILDFSKPRLDKGLSILAYVLAVL